MLIVEVGCVGIQPSVLDGGARKIGLRRQQYLMTLRGLEVGMVLEFPGEWRKVSPVSVMGVGRTEERILSWEQQRRKLVF